MKAAKGFIAAAVFAAVIAGMVFPFSEKVHASDTLTGFEFISLVVGRMAENENTGCIITKDKNGNVSVDGGIISEKQYRKYMKNYKVSQEQAKLLAVAVRLGLTKGKVKNYKKKITLAGALYILSRADELANGTIVTAETIEFCIENRIGDIGKVKKKERAGEAEGYIRGFVKGTAKTYSHTRTLKGHKKLTIGNARKLVDMLYDTSKRCTLSPDFQVTRTTKLPRNSELYPYILGSFPNSYYETGFNGMSNKNFFDTGVGLGADTLKERMKRLSFTFVFPYELEEFNKLEYPGTDFPYENQVFTETYRNAIVPNEMVASSEEFYRYALNVDYRTIESDKEWLSVMEKYLTGSEIKDYISHCKENKTVIECDLVSADRSSVYWYSGEYQCKVYAHVRIISDIPTEMGKTMGTDQDKYGYLYPVKRGYEPGVLYTRSVLGPMYLDYKLGDWVDLYLNTSGSADMYGCLCCSNTSRGIMIDYTGLYPWLIPFPFLN